MDDTHQGSTEPQLRAASYARLSETYDEAESVPTQLANADTHERLVRLFADPPRRAHVGGRKQYLLSGIARCSPAISARRFRAAV